MAVGAGLINRSGFGHSSDRRDDGSGLVNVSSPSDEPDLTGTAAEQIHWSRPFHRAIVHSQVRGSNTCLSIGKSVGGQDSTTTCERVGDRTEGVWLTPREHRPAVPMHS
jgi:hypothetical protein